MSRTQEDPLTANPFDPFGQWKAWRESNMDAWSKVMIDFVNSDAYAGASAQWLDTYVSMSKSFQQVIDQAMTQTLSQYNIPSTSDIERLAERLTNMELRLDDLDARLDDMLRLLKGLADAMVTTEQAVQKAERVAERAERAAEHAAAAAERVAAAAETPPKASAPGPAPRPGEGREGSDPKRQERK